MWKLTLVVVFTAVVVGAQNAIPKTGDELVTGVLASCVDEKCVKQNVLGYLNNILKMKSDTGRNIKNIDAAIFKRVARVFKTHEFHFQLPETIFDKAEIIYNPRTGLDLVETKSEARGLLKKKLLLPILLLLKLKMKALLPIFVALIGLKALKALILSKLAIGIVLGFIVYQLVTKSGMPMPMAMSMMPPPEPMTAYGPPGMMSTAPPSSYEPGWEPSQSGGPYPPSQSGGPYPASQNGGPYARVWTTSDNQNAHNLAYSAYYSASSTSTARP